MAAQINRISKRPPNFDTDRFVIAPLVPTKVRELFAVLLQDEQLAEWLPWMEDKSADGALREAFLLELQCAGGTTKVWGIVERARGMFVGAVVAKDSVGGIDLEVLCASQFWDQGVADEAVPPVAEWLENNMEVELHALH